MTNKERFVIENYYITTCGRVFSNMKYKDKSKYNELKFRTDKDGYYDCTLCYSNDNVKNSKPRQPFRIHRLVALKHLGDPPIDKPICGHRDNIKTNNSVCNLYWTDVSENTQHGFDNLSYKNIPQIEVEDMLCGTTIVYPTMSSALRGCNIPIGNGWSAKTFGYLKKYPNFKFNVIKTECND